MPPGSFLSPANYDDDASSLHSERSDQDTDSEDDEVLMGARTSAEIREHDRSVFTEEEERDKLLEESRRRERRGSAMSLPNPLKKLFSQSYTHLPGIGSSEHVNEMKGDGSGKRDRRRRRRERRSKKKGRLIGEAEHGERRELMYEMEEGGLKEGSSTGSSSDAEGSDEIDRRGLLGLHDDKSSRRRKWRRWCFIHLLIAVGFSILVLVAWKLSLNRKGIKYNQKIMSNGTALFAPTTILISLDGFRADFLNRGLTPRLNAFVKEGISPVYMNPSFPSVTFPNHYTLVTGLYPESHGVVGNTFWDAELKEEFFYTDVLAMQPKWWGGEPLWVTAENQGIRTAIHMWPGSEAHIMGVEPAFLDAFNGEELLANKVSRVLELLDKPGEEDEVAEVVDMRPQFIAAYVPNVDADGHLYGPNSTEIKTTINDVDTMLDQLFQGLDERNLTSIVNVVVLDDLMDINLIEHADGWPLYGLRPKNPADLQGLYDTLAESSAQNHNFEVYLRDENMPERYHFSNNERIAPLWIVPKTGWAIVTKEEFNVADAKELGIAYHPKGLHGYDHEHPLMRAIFIARGPAFPHAPNSRVEPFQNIEVYNIICDSLGLDPKANNGTLRLPLKPVGIHTPETAPEDPSDPELSPSPASDAGSDDGSDAIISISPVEASSAADPNVVPPTMIGVDQPEEVSVDRPVVGDETEVAAEDKKFLDWIKGKLGEVKDWFKELGGGGEKGVEGESGE
ncbi:putative pyrophosphatase/phosphodiesterase [Lachnellula subtilissima]|uniref:Putative pyrophosphatase/phosphodiesterase n=1 Tax=Lachnellula subtilissima TaxID=602034 RepID=A0A8H8UCB4_9HELO|nr:putative pyrophosphatase/phosphodiesterase [Lachnellula subtilissima]